MKFNSFRLRHHNEPLRYAPDDLHERLQRQQREVPLPAHLFVR